MTLLASILGCDLDRVHDEIARMEPYVDGLHFDIADGHFVPNITFGEPLLKSLVTKLPIDVHLMVTNPKQHITSVIATQRYSEGEAISHGRRLNLGGISLHIETDEDHLENIHLIKQAGLRAGIAIKAETPVERLEPIIGLVDYVILMTIVTGFSGNPFLPGPLEKVAWIRGKNPKAQIVIDGGVDDKSIHAIRAAGVDTVISGHYLFTAPDVKMASGILRHAD